ncbi:MAG: inner membrane CreD family protein [Thermoanaerobaculia bacterium]
MSVRRLLAIGFIFCCSAVAWFVLGGSVVHRTGGSEDAITPEVAGLWGDRQAQPPPTLSYSVEQPVSEEISEQRDDRTVTRTVTRRQLVSFPVPLASSRVLADLSLDHRRKGLLWYDTYTVDFAATYRAAVPEVPAGGELVLRFDFPSSHGLYDDFSLRLDGVEAEAIDDLSQGIVLRRPAEAGDEVEVEVAYRSRGLDTWRYLLGAGSISETRDFDLVVTTDFDAVDFPAGTLSPTSRERTADGWRLGWHFGRLVSGEDLGVDLPNLLNPGPLTARITFFAPVSLLFFLTVFVVLGALRRVDLHPANYFFLSAAFFAFHLLLAYLVDHIDLHVAFLVAALVSLSLVGSYLRLVPGARGAVAPALASQAVFLVLFSYAFFFQGYTGLTVTLGAIATLAVLMRLTAATDWGEVFARRSQVA